MNPEWVFERLRSRLNHSVIGGTVLFYFGGDAEAGVGRVLLRRTWRVLGAELHGLFLAAREDLHLHCGSDYDYVQQEAIRLWRDANVVGARGGWLGEVRLHIRSAAFGIQAQVTALGSIPLTRTPRREGEAVESSEEMPKAVLEHGAVLAPIIGSALEVEGTALEIVHRQYLRARWRLIHRYLKWLAANNGAHPVADDGAASGLTVLTQIDDLASDVLSVTMTACERKEQVKARLRRTTAESCDELVLSLVQELIAQPSGLAGLG